MRTIQAVAWKEIQVYFGTPTAYIVGMIFLALTGIVFAIGVVPSENNPFPEATLGSFFHLDFSLPDISPASPDHASVGGRAEAGNYRVALDLSRAGLGDHTREIPGQLCVSVGYAGPDSLLSHPAICLCRPRPRPVVRGLPGADSLWSGGLAIGMLTSTITSNQIVALIVGIGVIGALYVVHFSTDIVGGIASVLISEIGFQAHYEDFGRGVIDTKHVVYFLSVTAVFLFLAIRALEFRRWR